jgi:hypothetical protein
MARNGPLLLAERRVDQARHHFLAHAAFPGDEHGRVEGSDARGQFQHAREGGAAHLDQRRLLEPLKTG